MTRPLKYMEEFPYLLPCRKGTLEELDRLVEEREKTGRGTGSKKGRREQEAGGSSQGSPETAGNGHKTGTHAEGASKDGNTTTTPEATRGDFADGLPCVGHERADFRDSAVSYQQSD
ncbi:MAG: hypothetical protein ACLT5C_11865 [Blautia hansenii]